jgi:hypothetical protein
MAHQQSLQDMFVKDSTAVELPPLTVEEVLAHAESYNRARIPWDHLTKYYVFRTALSQKHIIPPSLSEAQELLELPNSHDIIDKFFVDGKPALLPSLGQYCDYWIVFRATEGRFRSDHNKKLKAFRFAKPLGMSNLRWAHTLKVSKPSDWISVSDPDKYETFIKITDACNNILCGIRRRLQNLEIVTNSGRACFQNLNHHPEFVPFQNNRTRDHQKYSWKFQRKQLGGNQGFADAEKPLCVAKQSVHFILRELHEWLPSFRRRRRIKNV